MANKPAWKGHLRVTALNRDQVLVVSEDGSELLEGSCFGLVARLVDGSRTPHRIAAELAGQVPPSRVGRILAGWERDGYTGGAADSSPQAAYWQSFGVDPQLLADTAVDLRVLGTEAGRLAEALQALGIRLGSEGGFLVAAVDDYLHPSLAGCNREALDSGRPWLLLKPVGRVVWLGPILRPGHTGCWECLAHRLLENRWLESLVWTARDLPIPAPSRAALPTTVTAAVSLAASEVAKWLLLGKSEALEGIVVTLDTATLEQRRHPLTRRPQCPACGQPGATRLFPPVLGRCHPTPLRHAWERLERHVSPITGIVPEIELQAGRGYAAVSVYAGRCNIAWSRARGPNRLTGRPETVQGKGPSDLAARVSCLGEAVERYSLIYQGDETRVRARLSDLDGPAVSPRELLLFSPAQYRRRRRWNAAHTSFHHIPEPFDEAVATDWTPAWSLTHHRTLYLPAPYCWALYPWGKAAPYCHADSNGCASGGTIEEATLRGLLELVERDAIALWWYNRVRRPAVDVDGVGAVRNELQRHRRALHLLDLTTDLEIPVIAAVSWAAHRRAILMGFGADLDPVIAARRAVSELYQMLSWGATTLWLQEALADHPHLEPSLASSLGPGDRRRNRPDALQSCLDRIAHRGIEVLAVDATRPDLDFPVVRVVAPGLRHHWARFGTGRLYQTPVELGWLAKPTPEANLNPFPFPL